MKSVKREFELLRSTSQYSSSSPYRPLTKDQLARTNFLIPRLCFADRVKLAAKLAMTALLTNPAPESVSLSALLDRLASKPGTERSLSFLARLRRAPPSHHRHVAPIAAVLAASYFKKSRPTDALTLFNWLVMPNSPSSLHANLAGVFVSGFSRNEMVLESLKVMRAVMRAGSYEEFRCSDSGKLVCRALLREARVREAEDLREALEGDDAKNVLLLLNRIIKVWTV